jgi:hypothetical protein
MIKIYDEETLIQHKSFIIKNGKPQASANRHDDAVMSTAGAFQLFQLCKPEISRQDAVGTTPRPAWADKIPDWNINYR